jgi:hypothetical protein
MSRAMSAMNTMWKSGYVVHSSASSPVVATLRHTSTGSGSSIGIGIGRGNSEQGSSVHTLPPPPPPPHTPQALSAHLSVTMSSTAPIVDVWLNVRAARPSSSSHTNLHKQQQPVAVTATAAWVGLEPR